MKETSGELIIHDTSTHSECICMVESTYTERILDVGMVVTSQMNTEYKYWLEQAIELASRICHVSLPRIEAEAIYRHWVPITYYYLPITTFMPT